MTVTTVASVPPDCHNPATTFPVPLLDSGGKVVPSIRQCTQRQQTLFVQLWPVVLPVCYGIRYFCKSKNNTTTHHAPLEPAVSYDLSILQPSSGTTLQNVFICDPLSLSIVSSPPPLNALLVYSLKFNRSYVLHNKVIYTQWFQKSN